MEEDLETPNHNGKISTVPNLQNPENGETHELNTYSELEFDSACSTPYVSAPSSPGRGPVGGGGFFYSAPASPMHFILSSTSTSMKSSSTTPSEAVQSNSSNSFEFEFSARYATTGSTSTGSMSSADELFLNGQIRPMRLSSHLQRPQILAPLLDLDETDGGDGEESIVRGRYLKLRDRSKSLRRRARSMSPLRSTSAFQWLEFEDERESTEIKEDLEEEVKQSDNHQVADGETPQSGSSSRSSSVGRSSKRWVFLKEFLYRSKSEGRSSTSSGHKFWSSLSFSPSANKDKKTSSTSDSKSKKAEGSAPAEARPPPATKKAVNGVGKRRVVRSAHELHYTTNRAQAEEMRKKTYLPYRQGLLGCLGFSSKSYGAMNGFARALNPVSSR